MKKRSFEYKISFFLVVFFILSLIPIMLLARYNYPCADDFGFSTYSHIAWLESHSIFQVLKGAWKTVVERWLGWQGTFSSIFLMALQPSIWGDAGYHLVPWIMIGAMSLSTMFFLYTILVKLFNVRKPVFISISMIYLIFALQCMIDKTQGFFWFNGAAHYMIPHCVALILIGLLIQLINNHNIRIFKLILASFLAFFVGGSNYITGLTIAIIFVSALLLLLYYKKKKELIILIIPFMFFITAFLLNTLAPGNSVRQGEMDIRPGVIKSILLSFYYCIEYVTETWFDWTYLFYILTLIPFIWEVVKKVGFRFSYRYPLLFFFYSYCILSAMFTPSLYATGIAGGGRIFNIIFLDLLLLVIGNIFYFLGWLYTHIPQFRYVTGSCLETNTAKKYFIGLFCLITFISTLYVKVNVDYFTTSSALNSLFSGEAAAYGQETAERSRLLNISDDKDITLKLFKTQPYLLYFSDISEDPGDWKNNSMARYYQKNSIRGTVNE